MIKKYKLGFIGCGNMGRAIVQGVLASDIASNEEIAIAVKTEQSAEQLREEFHCVVTTDNAEVAKDAEMILLAVKPYQMAGVLSGIRESISADQIIISVIAGKSIQSIEEGLMSMEVPCRTLPQR